VARSSVSLHVRTKFLAKAFI